MQENTSKKLFDILISKGFDPKTLNSEGKSIINIDKASIFSFDYQPNKDNYGTVVILLDDEENFDIFYGDNIGKSMDRDSKNDWYELLTQLRYFAKRNLLSFSLKNINRLKYSMQGMAAIKEGLYEGWNGTSKTSYNPQRKNTRIIARHSKRIGEGDQRFRNIKSLFIENADGERFKLPFVNIGGARAMARHVSEGGNPYDVFGQHITETVKDIGALGRFMRVRSLNESEETSNLVENCKTHYKKLRENLKTIGKVRGYNKYKESWSPADINEDDAVIENIRSLLLPEGSDARVDEAIPALTRVLAGNITIQEDNPSIGDSDNMKELRAFENWAQNISEGTWAIPDGEDAVKELRIMLANALPVGVDALNATEALYNVIGDDNLFDNLDELAQTDPQADARPLIIDWLKEFAYSYNGMDNILQDLEIDVN